MSESLAVKRYGRIGMLAEARIAETVDNALLCDYQ